jgi:hypothetical protein
MKYNITTFAYNINDKKLHSEILKKINNNVHFSVLVSIVL